MNEFAARIAELQIAIDAIGTRTSSDLDAKLFLMKLQTKEIEAQRNYWVQNSAQLTSKNTSEKAA